MFQSKYYIPTLKETPKDAEIRSHKYLLKAGYINLSASGIYSYLPLATRVLSKIENIVRSNIDVIGASELKLPLLHASEYWKESGRWNEYGSELIRLNDRNNREFALSPTHEEIVVSLFKNTLKSYKNYPKNIYQIDTKFRDELRPRFGLLRSREFIMFDGYSLHQDEECLLKTYQQYYDAYKNILQELDLDYVIVNADNGQMGGKQSHEFMVLADIGEDDVVVEPGVEVGYNSEAAYIFNDYEQMSESKEDIKEVHTPGITSINRLKEVVVFNDKVLLKSMCYVIDDKFYLVVINSNRELEETKLLNQLGAKEIRMASLDELEQNNLIKGYIGPKGTNNINIIYDQEVQYLNDLVIGANKEEYHLMNVNFKDLDKGNILDVVRVQDGDFVSEKKIPVQIKKGIEVGHIFALGDRYTKAMSMTFEDANQKQQTPLMGCYGIGISRILSAYIEQKIDDEYMEFGANLTPFDIQLVPLSFDDEDQREFTLDLVSKLEQQGKSVLVDDRDIRPGNKFSDCELIGIKDKYIIGKKYKENILEKMSKDKKEEVRVEELCQKI
ncbi:MAG: proline--tRNA ligase [Mycoplasmatales bacterium]